MTQNRTICTNCVRVAMFAASVLVVLSGFNACHASCGAYVYSRFHTPDQHTRSVNQHAQANKLDVVNLEISRRPNNDVNSSNFVPDSPAPCHGPNCSENPTPLVPFAPPTTVGSSNQDRLIFGHLTIELPSEVSQREDLQSDTRARRGFPLLIEMPPETLG